MNVLETIKKHGSESKFIPIEFGEPLSEPPGSVERIQAFRDRIEKGEELFQEHDKNDCEGHVGLPVKNGAKHMKGSV